MSCRDCVFRSEYRDMGASADVCTLHFNLARAVNACDHSEDCKYRLTRKEAMTIAFERAGGKPTDEPTAAERREQSGDPDEIDDPDRAFQNSMNVIFEELRKGVQGMVDIAKDAVERIYAFAREGAEDDEHHTKDQTE